MNNKQGFTIVEILVVLSMVTFLLSIIMVSLNDARLRARDAKRVSELIEMYKEAQLIHVEPATPFLGCVTDNSPANTCTNPDLSKFHDPLKSLATCNATSNSPCEYSISGADGNTFQGVQGVINSPNTQNFQICAYIESGAASIQKGLVSVGSVSGETIASGCK